MEMRHMKAIWLQVEAILSRPDRTNKKAFFCIPVNKA